MTCNAFSFGCLASNCAQCVDNETPAEITVGELVRMQNRINAFESEVKNLKCIILKGIGQHGQPDDEWTGEAVKALGKD